MGISYVGNFFKLKNKFVEPHPAISASVLCGMYVSDKSITSTKLLSKRDSLI